MSNGKRPPDDAAAPANAPVPVGKFGHLSPSLPLVVQISGATTQISGNKSILHMMFHLRARLGRGQSVRAGRLK